MYPYNTDDVIVAIGRVVFWLIVAIIIGLGSILLIHKTFQEDIDTMPRVIGSANNVVEVQDGLSGDVHVLYYRLPSNTERAAYMARAFKRKGKKIINDLYNVRVEKGYDILSGIAPGTIEYQGKMLSSNDADPGYSAEWREILRDHAPDILAAMAVAVFEGTQARQGDVEVVTADEPDPI